MVNLWSHGNMTVNLTDEVRVTWHVTVCGLDGRNYDYFAIILWIRR
jgi:hypothetical protein